jgi:hypothetical protein
MIHPGKLLGPNINLKDSCADCAESSDFADNPPVKFSTLFFASAPALALALAKRGKRG